MKRLTTSFVLLAAVTLGLNAGATELSASAHYRECKTYFRGQMHLKGNEARDGATKMATEFAENNLKRDCSKKNGTLSLGIEVKTSCGAFEEAGSFHLLDGRVCVTCEATATGNCT